jgi:hypothetical protein
MHPLSPRPEIGCCDVSSVVVRRALRRMEVRWRSWLVAPTLDGDVGRVRLCRPPAVRTVGRDGHAGILKSVLALGGHSRTLAQPSGLSREAARRAQQCFAVRASLAPTSESAGDGESVACRRARLRRRPAPRGWRCRPQRWSRAVRIVRLKARSRSRCWHRGTFQCLPRRPQASSLVAYG